MNLDAAFWPALWELSRATQTRPEIFLAVWFAESGLDPTAANSIGCIGLNQTCPASIGGPGFPATPEAFKASTASEQLAWIAQNVKRAAAQYGPFRSAARYYQANFLPGTLGVAKRPGDVVAAHAGPYAAAYDANRLLDVTGDGAITLDDLASYLERKVAQHSDFQSAVLQTYANRPEGAPFQSPQLALYEPGPRGNRGAGLMAGLFVSVFAITWLRRRRRIAA